MAASFWERFPHSLPYIRLQVFWFTFQVEILPKLSNSFLMSLITQKHTEEEEPAWTPYILTNLYTEQDMEAGTKIETVP